MPWFNNALILFKAMQLMQKIEIKDEKINLSFPSMFLSFSANQSFTFWMLKRFFSSFAAIRASFKWFSTLLSLLFLLHVLNTNATYTSRDPSTPIHIDKLEDGLDIVLRGICAIYRVPTDFFTRDRYLKWFWHKDMHLKYVDCRVQRKCVRFVQW